jgi:hypothetical protein
MEVMTLKMTSITPKWRIFILLRVHLLNRLVYFDESSYCGNGIKGDLDRSKISVCPQ